MSKSYMTLLTQRYNKFHIGYDMSKRVILLEP